MRHTLDKAMRRHSRDAGATNRGFLSGTMGAYVLCQRTKHRGTGPKRKRVHPCALCEETAFYYWPVHRQYRCTEHQYVEIDLEKEMQ